MDTEDCTTIGFVVAMGFTLGAFVVSMFGYYTTDFEEITTETPIVALSNTSSLKGSGSIIYVSVTQDDNYRYMERNDDGSLSMGLISSTTPIFENADKDTARIVRHTRTRKDNFWTNLYDFWKMKEVKAEIYVPKGTVKGTFDVDVTK